MKTFLGTVLMFIIFLAFSGTAYADDRDRAGGLAFRPAPSSGQESPSEPSSRMQIEVSLIRASRNWKLSSKLVQTLWA